MKELMNNKVVKIATHQGIFHADEIMAVSLLKVFVNKVIEVDRVNHQEKKFDKYDIVVDVSRKFDNKKFFDHHQNTPTHGGKSSAGLIFEKLIEEGLLLKGVEEELRPVIKTIDMQDLGLEDAPVGHIGDVISYYNTSNPYNEEQNESFMFTIEVISKYLDGVKKKYEAIEEAKENLLKSEIIDNNKVIYSDHFIPFWNDAIFEVAELDAVDAFLWWDKDQEVYKIQQVPDVKGGFGRRGRKISYKDPMPKGITFIHKGEFFAVGIYKEALLSLLEDA